MVSAHGGPAPGADPYRRTDPETAVRNRSGSMNP
ncbi:hypothetical protein SUDANB121_02445 [Nocardiopsis dassonvillei]